MNFPRPALAALLLFTFPVWTRAEAPKNAGGTLSLKNDRAEVLVLPAAAGRIVSYKRPGGENVFKEYRNLWENTAAQFGDPVKWNGFPSVGGQLHWTGPQANFWNHQDLRPEQKGQPWPPDPWQEIVAYEVVKQGADLLVLSGPASPVTGLAMTKTYELAPDGKLTVSVEAVNRRDTPVRWDLWSVTRVPPFQPVFARSGGAYPPLFIEGDTSGKRPPIPWKMTKAGVIGLLQETPLPNNGKSHSRKALITPPPGPTAIVYVMGRDLFIKRFEPASPEECAPGHAPVELYLERGQNDIQELEFHAPIRTLAPGESMSITETWELREITTPAKTREDWERIATEILVEETAPPKN
jgi:hypothetical protein